MKIMALGPEGTNGHEVAKKAAVLLHAKYGSFVIEYCSQNIEVLKRAQAAGCLGVVPVQNSSVGLVSEVVQGFWLEEGASASLQVIGEVELPVQHNLLVHPSLLKLTDITMVISHQQALDQCRKKLQQLLPDVQQKSEKSTALAAQLVARDPTYKTAAAIASSFAGEFHALKVLRSGMEDCLGNTTRFHIVGPEPAQPTGFDRTAVIFIVKHCPGTLYQALGKISLEGVNISYIQSIPQDKPEMYAFYCEFDQHQDTDLGRKIMEGLRGQDITERIIVLGSYPRAAQAGKGGLHGH